MKFLANILLQTGRNLQKTWASQLMTLLTVSLSVLIFTFFFLIYTNMIKAGEHLDDDLRLTIYLEEEPVPEMQAQLAKKINKFEPVEKIIFTSRAEAFERLKLQLGNNKDVLADMSPAFLPPSMEVYPQKHLRNLSHLKSFSAYLSTLPGAVKVQYGQGWIERFNHFTQLLRVIVLLSGALLILTATFMVANTIRLAVMARQAELEILRLLGATNSYIRTPFLIEGLLQGLLGSAAGIASLFLVFQWVTARFSSPGFLSFLEFSFFRPPTIIIIISLSVMLCAGGSLSATRKFLRI